MKYCFVFLFWAALALGACQPGPSQDQTPSTVELDSLDTASFIKNPTEPTGTNAAERIAQAEVEVVYDLDEVKSIRQKLADNQVDTHEKTPPDLAKQFVAGQTGAAAALAQQLMITGEDAPRTNLLLTLSNYAYDEALPPLGDDLGQAVIVCLADTAAEMMALNVLTYAKPTGWQAAIENRLRTGQSANRGLLAAQLAKATWSPAAFNLARAQITGGQAKPAELAQWFECLASSAQNGPDSLKAMVLALATQHVNSIMAQPKPKATNQDSDGAFLEDSDYYGDPYHGAAELVCELGGRAELPLIHRLRAIPNYQASALAALVRLEGAKHKPLILSFLRNQNRFTAGLEAAVSLGPQAWDNQLGTYILTQLDNQQYQYNLTQVVQALYKLGQTQNLMGATPWLRNRDLARKIQFYNQLNSTDLPQMAESLYNLGLIPARLTPAQVAQAQQAATNSWGGTGIVQLLQATGRLAVYENEYHEDDLSTQDYTYRCYLNFAKLMPFTNAYFGVEEITDEAGEYNGGYKLIYSSEEKQALTTTVSDTEQMEYHLVALLNRALERGGYTQRFVPVTPGEYTAGYFYGDEARVSLLLSKWGLEWAPLAIVEAARAAETAD
ncbi:MAG: hypothetical protein MUC97_03375 [Bernardetiaceae bacterium]|jgi:hypothetical protein|nr:hypothetical protein [Bernardetiaceae bacterium]